MSTTPKQDETVANPDVVTKYKAAGDIATRVLAEVKKLAVPGAKIADLCKKGDELLVQETDKVFNNKKFTKGIAFPTSVSPNDTVAHFAPLEASKEAEQVLAKGDVVKITLGAQIDGYPSIVGDSVYVGGELAADNEIADLIAAAYFATEAALRKVKPGNKNWEVTKVVDQVVKEFGCSALEGMLSQQHGKNSVDGKKKIILNPTEQQRKDFETFTFEENEVYGLDILVTKGSPKVISKETPTTIYKKSDLTYQLKLKTSRQAISEVQKKAGTFPFSAGILDDQKRVRMAFQEPLNHGLLSAFDVSYSKDGKPVVQLFTTFALTKTGILKLAAAPAPEIVASKKVVDEELAALLNTSLKTNKKKKAAKPAAASA